MEDNTNLILRAQRGDQDALSELYNQNYFAVLGAIRSLIKDEDDAIDLLQDTFIKAFGHLDQLKGDFGPWVKRIGLNTAKDFLKKKKPILFSQLQGEEDRNDSPIEESFAQETFEGRPDIIMDEHETARLIGEILESIPEEQRIVINLCYYQEMSYKEISATLGIPENLVRSRLNLGREKVEKQVLALEKEEQNFMVWHQSPSCCSCSEIWTRKRQKCGLIKQYCMEFFQKVILFRKMIILMGEETPRCKTLRITAQ